MRINYWRGSRRPPLLSDFDNIQDYRDALSDWRATPNSNLFQYIPLSSTEDRKGLLYIADWQIECIGITCQDPVLRAEPASLFFAHMEEARELTDLLQRTYVSVSLMRERNNGEHVINTRKAKHLVPANPPECDLLKVRTNPGDSLIPGEIPITLTFTATATCETQGDMVCDPTGYCECEAPVGAVCPGGEVILTLTLNELMPLAHENFNRIVSSPYSPLQKVYPKMQPDAPIQGKLDMPAYSLVNYIVFGDFSLVQVINAGSPP